MILHEWKRKVWHIGTGIIGFSIHFATGRDSGLSASILLVASIIMFSGEFIRLKFSNINKRVLSLMGSVMRKKESNHISGMPYYALGVCLTFYLYPEKIALISISILVFIDPVCSTIGRAFGKNKIFKNKTLEGSLAGFLSSFALILGITLTYAPFSFSLITFTILGAFLCSLSELFAIIDDNFSLPIMSGASLVLLNHLLAVF